MGRRGHTFAPALKKEGCLSWNFPSVSTCLATRSFSALNQRKVALEAQGRTLFNLSVGTPDFEAPAHVKQALMDAAKNQDNWKYSLRDLPELLDAVCSCYQRRFGVTITPDQVMSVNGSQEGMGHLGLALCDEGSTVLLPDPGYPVFTAGAKVGGATPGTTR